jgi:hypothetical protein
MPLVEEFLDRMASRPEVVDPAALAVDVQCHRFGGFAAF